MEFYYTFPYHWAEKGIIPLRILICLNFAEDINHSYRSITYYSAFFMLRITRFLWFSKVSDAPMVTRFKQIYIPQLELMFSKMVDYTEPICQAIDSTIATIPTLDTSSVELYIIFIYYYQKGIYIKQKAIKTKLSLIFMTPFQTQEAPNYS